MNARVRSRSTTCSCLGAIFLLAAGCADTARTTFQSPSANPQSASEAAATQTGLSQTSSLFEIEPVAEYLFPTPAEAIRAILGDVERRLGEPTTTSSSEPTTGPSGATAARLEDQAVADALRALVNQAELQQTEDSAEGSQSVEFTATTATGEARTTVVFVDAPEAHGWAMHDLFVPLDEQVCEMLEAERAG